MKRSQFLAILAAPFVAPLLPKVEEVAPFPYKNYGLFIPDGVPSRSGTMLRLANQGNIIRQRYEVTEKGIFRTIEFKHGEETD